MCPADVADHPQQQVVIERFLEKCGGARELACEAGLVELFVGGDHNGGDRPAIRREALQERRPRHAGDARINEQAIRLPLGETEKKTLRRVKAVWLEAGRAQEAHERFSHGGVVIDDRHFDGGIGHRRGTPQTIDPGTSLEWDFGRMRKA